MRVASMLPPLVFASIPVVIVGCGESGPAKYPVTGTVKYKGEPVKMGTISFRSLDGVHTAAGAVVNGQYELTAESGLTPGKYMVAINYPDPSAPQPAADEAPGDPAIAARDFIPPKYNDMSELTAEIKAEDNVVDFDLK